MGLPVMLGDRRNSAGLVGCSLARARPELLLLSCMSVCSLSSPPEAIDGGRLAAVEIMTRRTYPVLLAHR